jgi:hypothetical protein
MFLHDENEQNTVAKRFFSLKNGNAAVQYVFA